VKPCTKQRHPTPAAAERHRDSLIRRGRARGPIEVYQCRKCSTPENPVFHIGHAKIKDKS
jgi:ribosomal protein L40E